jgi:Secretion system C-terminal sorting domain
MFTLKLGQVSPLPIQLLSFTAKPVDNEYVRCDWVTASEIDNDYFTVERSTNGIDFEVSGITDGAGTSSSQLSYSFSDVDPYLGLTYYRLKQTDFNGKSTISEIIAVMLTEANSFVGIPNPATNKFEVYFNSEIPNDFTLTDMNGRVVFEKKQIYSGFSMDTSPFSSGIYQVKVTNDISQPMYLKLVVKH